MIVALVVDNLGHDARWLASRRRHGLRANVATPTGGDVELVAHTRSNVIER
jgi:hypothetical protein